MLKFDIIEGQLCFGNLKKAVFGAYDAHDRQNKEFLSIRELDILYHLQEYEIDFASLVNDYNNNELEIDTIDLDDFYYNDSEFDNIYINIKKSDNSYNWSCSAIFNYDIIDINDIEYIAIKFHRFGDIRANYTDYMLLKLDSDEFFEILQELNSYYSFEYNQNIISLDYNIFNESNCFNIYSDGFNIDLYDIYIDIDNENEKDIQASIIDYLKENNYIK